ncbi:hypothetical protein Thiowin_01974 [Thiorhodovibrio winogradskyi]|uniref:Uncharacterized protein n=1 Tax=Thiorhodovibrio winogradskyi TaxID=77007 RepID=A0ABZ0SBM1_9GAMM
MLAGLDQGQRQRGNQAPRPDGHLMAGSKGGAAWHAGEASMRLGSLVVRRISLNDKMLCREAE